MIRKTSAFVLVILAVLVTLQTTPRVEADEPEMLKIDVGPSTLLSTKRYQNQSSLSVSPTNVVAAFYTDETGRVRFYRTSTDGGRTWSTQKNAPPEMGGGQCSGALAKRGASCEHSMAESQSMKSPAGFSSAVSGSTTTSRPIRLKRPKCICRARSKND